MKKLFWISAVLMLAVLAGCSRGAGEPEWYIPPEGEHIFVPDMPEDMGLRSTALVINIENLDGLLYSFHPPFDFAASGDIDGIFSEQEIFELIGSMVW